MEEQLFEKDVEKSKKEEVKKHEGGVLTYGPMVDFKDQLGSNFRQKWNEGLREAFKTIDGALRKKEPVIVSRDEQSQE